MCSSCTVASIVKQYGLLGSTQNLTWPWPKVKFWHWTFNVNMYIFQRVSTSGTRRCRKYVAIFLISKVILENYFCKKALLCKFLTSVAKPVEVRSILTTCRQKNFNPRPHGGREVMQPPWVFLEWPPNDWVVRAEILHSLWGILCATFGKKMTGSGQVTEL